MKITAAEFGLVSWPIADLDLVPVVWHAKDYWDQDLILISSGTVKAQTTPTKALPYIPTAYLPRPPWKPAPPKAVARPTDKRIEGPRCGCIVLPPALFERFSAQTYFGSIPERNTKEYAPIIEYLEEKYTAVEPIIVNGATWDMPGLETVTYDPSNNAFLGLHLDSWDGVSYSERENSRTRICVNLGPGPRSFLYVPISLRSAQRALSCSSASGSLRAPHQLFPSLFETFPELPVIRITTPPGTAYYADTDNLIHDGSSLFATTPSLHFTVRGRFSSL